MLKWILLWCAINLVMAVILLLIIHKKMKKTIDEYNDILSKMDKLMLNYQTIFDTEANGQAAKMIKSINDMVDSVIERQLQEKKDSMAEKLDEVKDDTLEKYVEERLAEIEEDKQLKYPEIDHAIPGVVLVESDALANFMAKVDLALKNTNEASAFIRSKLLSTLPRYVFIRAELYEPTHTYVPLRDIHINRYDGSENVKDYTVPAYVFNTVTNEFDRVSFKISPSYTLQSKMVQYCSFWKQFPFNDDERDLMERMTD